VRNGREYAPLKQRAVEAAVEALGRLREGASYCEMETAAVVAVQPTIREHAHEQDCQRMVARVCLFDATPAEQEAAKEAARKALAALPIGAAAKEIEIAHEAAVAPYKAAVALRKEEARQESEKQTQRRAAEWRAELHLDHIARYLAKEFDFDGGSWERCREAERLRPLIRKTLIEELLRNPNLSLYHIRRHVEDQIDDGD
jgi:hypothetical protein